MRPADVVGDAFLLERTSAAQYPLARATSHPLEGTSAQSAGEGPAGSGGAPQAPAATAAYFAATGLPLGSYDLILLTARGRVEGVDLRPPQAGRAGEGRQEEGEETGALSPGTGSRAEGGVRPKEAASRPLSDKDAESIRKLVLGMTSFADRRRILFLEGAGTEARPSTGSGRARPVEARVLVEELTTRKTSLPSPVPFVVWRVEVWFYRKEFGAWDRYDSRVVARERLPVTEFEQTTWVFDPALGGLEVSEATPVVEVAYEVPQDFDPAHGLVAGKQKLRGDQESR